MGKRSRFNRSVSRQRINPYFQRKSSLKVSRGLIIFLISVLLVLGSLYYVIFSGFFAINSISVSGGGDNMKSAVSKDLENKLLTPFLFVFPRNLVFFVSVDKLRSELLEAYPLATVEIEKGRQFLNVAITEKVRTFYLLKDDIMYAVDREGRVIGRVDDLDRIRIELELEEGKGPPIIEDHRGVELGDGSVALPAVWLEDIVRLFDLVESRTMLTPISARLIDEEGRVDLPTESGVVLYMSLDRSIDEQLGKLEALIERKLVDITGLSYIDLRFTNRLFYH